jgi:hypothetical protein
MFMAPLPFLYSLVGSVDLLQIETGSFLQYDKTPSKMQEALPHYFLFSVI